VRHEPEARCMRGGGVEGWTDPAAAPVLTEERLAATFPRVTAPGTSRMAYQLTAGDATCYPLYYFIPSISRGGRYLVYHRAAAGEVQLWRLDLGTGEHTALTRADDRDCAWTPWDTDPGRGVLDHRSVLNVACDEVIYFARGEARAVRLETLEDRSLFALPPGRKATGQNCCSPDGRYLFFIHHDAELDRRIHGTRPSPRHLSRGTEMVRVDLDRGEHRLVVRLNSPFHHVHPCGASHLVFSSPALEKAPLWTDYDGGWFAQLRTQDADGRNTVHYAATRRGLHYELDGAPCRVGTLSPETHARREFAAPSMVGLHVGFDPEGRRFTLDGLEEGGRSLYHLVSLPETGDPAWTRLTGPWPLYGAGGQKTHAHPRFTPCGRWIQMVAGDPATETNHIFLVDARDVAPSRGLPVYGADADGPFPV
jgi:hypothetical protein